MVRTRLNISSLCLKPAMICSRQDLYSLGPFLPGLHTAVEAERPTRKLRVAPEARCLVIFVFAADEPLSVPPVP
jgi:hypothetical protein